MVVSSIFFSFSHFSFSLGAGPGWIICGQPDFVFIANASLNHSMVSQGIVKK